MDFEDTTNAGETGKLQMNSFLSSFKANVEYVVEGGCVCKFTASAVSSATWGCSLQWGVIFTFLSLILGANFA